MNVELIKEEIKKVMAVDEEEFAMIAKIFSVKKLKKNEIWESAGRIGKYMGFVNQGILREFTTKDGEEFTTLFFAERSFVGNYISNLQQTPADTSIQALEPCELLVTSFERFQKLAMEYPSMVKYAQYVSDQKLFELNSKASSILMDSPEERYYKLMQQQPDIHSRVKQYYIAQYLGIRPESLSRIRKRYQKK